MLNTISTDICIIGAGPVGLFAVFEAGLLKLRCHVVDALPAVGGQLTEIYPKKPIYDIPGFPEVLAGDLVRNLMRQIEPFHPTFTLGERVEGFAKLDDGSFQLFTTDGTEVLCKAVAIAGGLGSFEPRKPAIGELERFEQGRGVYYMVRDPETFRDKRIVIAGGGDSALDWTIFLADIAKEVTLVHRGTTFRGAADSAEKVKNLHEAGRARLVLSSNVSHVHGIDDLEAVTITANDGTTESLPVDAFIPLFGLTPKLGPIGEWNLGLDNDAVQVDTLDYSTSVPGVYAIGDINTYPGKLKLILCGFHEAALMAQGAYKYMFPDKKYVLKYTTVNGVPTM
ncbi:FAD-dependent pyridine nucleotide-disulphide oxidoreductase [Hymenobacter roseosalivarius DSM 11622]|uniref:Ferredoxin--NADP reductase n=1 Tax=Hymenobacter roseosalivarius DSM 11622 TaxID=645990 RepID=A0A1W1VTZ4_9BACT|nr:NAD(P)/FAD-dependent oxidoreductase [Hymenobacter roseosalivarius]SMB96832.1 FAD-dependent pyridine nucleotide-disulphide oxidoreductase [Hymenobacter roseosalivarius DSM 11622]